MNFFPGEELENEIEDMGMIIHTDEEINEKYIKGEVRIVTEQGRFQLTTIENIVEGEDYILNPEYQRRHRWNNERKSKLIESFIMNVPVPPIFLYEKDYSVYEVMDGLQRLTAIYDFYTDRFSLVGLEEWGELNGLVYSQLPIQVKKGIDRRYLSSIILLKETAKTDKEAQRLKQMVFERINSGGEKLEPQETRNALYNGELNQLCIKIARDKYFCRMWGIPEQINEEDEQELDKELIENPLYKKMSDVELILRFFAFR
ncbi:GmrSD restriction endonuclease domain-containing protein, partial [Bacillus pseudomycoides]